MDEGIVAAAGAGQGGLEIIARTNVITVQKPGVTNSSEYPGCRFPAGFGFGQQIPGVLVGFDGLRVFALRGEGIADFAEAVDADVQMRVESRCWSLDSLLVKRMYLVA